MTFSKIRSSEQRRAASLIEVMIVVAIIGTLIALLIPAIQAVRNSAKKVQNQNNIKQILLAAHDYISEHNGQLPQADGWPGEGCCTLAGYIQVAQYGPNACNPNYLVTTNQPGNIVETCTTCPNTLVSKSTITNWGSPVNTLDPAKIRDNWTDGTPYFVLLPYLDQKGLYDQSYGPMISGQQFKEVDLKKCVCNQWDPNYSWVCDNYNCAGVPIQNTNQTKVSTKNFGWQGGKVPALVKTFLGFGDPTSEFPGMPAPLSYPMFPNITGSIELHDTSFQAYITEAYAGCNTSNPWNTFNPTTGENYTFAGNNFGSQTYNSWAASSFVNIDLDPIPMVPGYGTVTSTPETYQSRISPVWTGVKTPDVACETAGIQAGGYYMGPECACAAVLADPNFPGNSGTPSLTNDAGVSPFCGPGGAGRFNYSSGLWSRGNGSQVLTKGTQQWGHVSNNTTSFYSNSSDYPDHIGEWYYSINLSIRNNTYWLDHPPAYAIPSASNYYSGGLCSTAWPMSMVPGSLNVGMLDGSVRSIGKDITYAAWNALIVGQAPTDDANNW